MCKYPFKASLLLLFLFFAIPQISVAQSASTKLLDRIVAVVNDNVILKSDIDGRVTQVLAANSDMRFNEDLWYQVLKSSVDNYVLLEQAKIDSIVVSDTEVTSALDARIQEIAAQAGGEQALERAWGKSLIQIRAEFRDDFREELIIERLRGTKMQEVTITRSEVQDFFNRIPSDSLPIVPESVELAQIVKIPKPKAEAEEKTKAFAETLRDSILNHNVPLEELAKKYSNGPSAPQGGRLGLIPMSDLVSEYSAAASALRPGEISEVVRTVFGYHIIKLNKRVGDKIDTSHILLYVDEAELDEESAIADLNQLRDSLLTSPDADFFDLARKESDDKNTNTQGGRLINMQNGQRSLPLTSLDPALYRIVLLLNDEGDISEPKPFNPELRTATKAFRIVKLIKKVDEHRANLEQDYILFENIALQNKQMREFETWLEDIKQDIYIEYRIPVPDYISGTASR